MIANNVSWVFGEGKDAIGGNMCNLDLASVLSKLRKIYKKNGSVTIDLMDESLPLQFLQFECNNGIFVLFIGVDLDEDFNVITSKSEINEETLMTIIGEGWADSELCTSDYYLISAVVERLFEHFT